MLLRTFSAVHCYAYMNRKNRSYLNVLCKSKLTWLEASYVLYIEDLGILAQNYHPKTSLIFTF